MAVSSDFVSAEAALAGLHRPVEEGSDLCGFAVIEPIDDGPGRDRDPVADCDVRDEQQGCSATPAVGLDEGAGCIDVDNATWERDAHLNGS
jgi:hypothetical protein